MKSSTLWPITSRLERSLQEKPRCDWQRECDMRRRWNDTGISIPDLVGFQARVYELLDEMCSAKTVPSRKVHSLAFEMPAGYAVTADLRPTRDAVATEIRVWAFL